MSVTERKGDELGYRTTAILMSSAACILVPIHRASAQTIIHEIAPAASDPSDIIVTARCVNERVSHVPASITAFSADAIDKASITRAEVS